MAEPLIKRIRTEKGALQIDYNALANLPSTDTELATAGQAADAKATGDAIANTNNVVKQLSSDTEASINQLAADTESKINQLSSDTTTSIGKLNSDLNKVDSDAKDAINQLSSNTDNSIDNLMSIKLNKSGDEMTGELSMNSNKITNLAAPTDNTDATTKQYVDDKHMIFTATLSTEWDIESAPYTQIINIVEIIETDYPHIMPIYSEELEVAILQRENWSIICKAEAMNGCIVFSCYEKIPDMEIPIQIEVHR